EHQRLVVAGELGDLAQQSTAVRTANGVQDLAELSAAKIGLVGEIAKQTARLSAWTHYPPPGESQQLVLRFGLKLYSRHLKAPVQICNECAANISRDVSCYTASQRLQGCESSDPLAPRTTECHRRIRFVST